MVWYKGIEKSLCISDHNNRIFHGKYKKYPLEDNDFININDFILQDNILESKMTFEENGIYLIEISNEEDETIEFINIKVEDEIDSQIINIIDKLNILIDSGIDQDDLSDIYNKLGNLETNILALKKKTKAFINR